MTNFLENNHILFNQDVAIAALTGMGQSGTLPLIVYPHSEEQLIIVLKEVRRRNLSFDIFGGLTNTYLCSTFIKDVIIITTKMKHLEWKDNTIIVESGYNLTKLSKELCKKAIAGYDGFIGIPGTVGAAAINNSGAFRSSMSNVVRKVKLLDSDNNIIYLTNEELHYSQRNSILKGKHDYILLSVELDISQQENIEALNKRIISQSEYRKNIIDGKRKSLGTVFVSASMHELYKRNRVRILAKKIINQPLKWLLHSQKLNTWLDFFFLGVPHLAKHCDSINRFAWDKETQEKDFFDYIGTMQRLAGGRLNLEIEIKQ
jgi:UDP-N-acetylmuramate dehydrogenase